MTNLIGPRLTHCARSTNRSTRY